MSALALLIALGLPAAEAAPAPPPPPRRGEVLERIACAGDPERTYALYLPPAYDAGRLWPVVILMDPRGRALVPMKLFVAAAQRRGFILMSSYDTASDGPWEPNEKAVNAMLREAHDLYAIDTHRVYLAGFSGTARAGWDFALRLKDHVAGLIGFGGGLPFEPGRLKSVPFAFFGGAGRLDFNYEEMRALDAQLDAMGAPHRFEPYDGPHSWGPEPVCAEALDWMEIQAMKSSLRPRDASLVEAIHAGWSGTARALETAGDPVAALHAWRGLARDFAGLLDVTEARARTAALEGSKEVRRTLSRMTALSKRETAYQGRLSAFLKSFHAAGRPPAVGRSLIDLQIASLKRRSADASDPLDAQAAQRLLEMVFVHAAFYEPREFIENGDPDRALAMLQVASAIKPGDPRVLFGQARAQARAGRKDLAIETLRKAVAAGVGDPAVIEGDEVFAPLRAEPGYVEILERLRAQSARP